MSFTFFFTFQQFLNEMLKRVNSNVKTDESFPKLVDKMLKTADEAFSVFMKTFMRTRLSSPRTKALAVNVNAAL